MKSFALAMLASSVAAAGDLVYTYDDQATQWPTLEGSEVCGTGVKQSPIDLTASADVLSPATLVDSDVNADWYTLADSNFVLTTETIASPTVSVGTHAVKVVYNSDADVITTNVANYQTGEIDNWNLAQFHFHWLSEHTVDGMPYDLEVHFVHLNAAGDAALVLGVMFDASLDVEDPLLAQFDWTADTLSIASLDLQSWLNSLDLSSRWNYEGSLTTPPCTEFVNWNVLTTVMPMSQAQLEGYLSQFPEGFIGNARDVQPLGDRTLTVINSADLQIGLTDLGYEFSEDAGSLLSLSAFAMASTIAALN
jgi:carbonic anhydrase